jgi:mannosyltransferase
MATQVPVVATDVGAFSELLVTGADETGILIPADDLAAMAGAAASLMDDPERSGHAGERGLSRAIEGFSIKGEATKIGEIYEKLLSSAT